MELQKFLEQYLPDYDNKKKDWEKSTNMDADKYIVGIETKGSFYDWYFPEALQNFTDKICGIQKTNCVEVLEKEKVLKIIHPEDSIALLEAKQPEIE